MTGYTLNNVVNHSVDQGICAPFVYMLHSYNNGPNKSFSCGDIKADKKRNITIMSAISHAVLVCVIFGYVMGACHAQ